MSKQTENNVGIYLRLSQEDLREGDSLSIENQKIMLTKYVHDKGWTLVSEYVDDGYSGTDFVVHQYGNHIESRPNSMKK